MNSVVLVESQGSCALVRIVRLQKFGRRDMIFTVHLNRLIDENTPLGQSTIETCLQEAYSAITTKSKMDVLKFKNLVSYVNLVKRRKKVYCRQLWLLNHDLVNFQFKIFSQSFLFTGFSSDGHINKFLQRIFFVSSYKHFWLVSNVYLH